MTTVRRQLTPRRYSTEYSDHTGQHSCTWRMWLGRSFGVVHN